MQVNGSEKARYDTPYRSNTNAKHSSGFLKTKEGGYTPGATDANPAEQVGAVTMAEREEEGEFSGDFEPSYQIGTQSFTEKEWDEFLERFDSLEEVIRELMRERHKKQREEEEERRRLLIAEATSCTYPDVSPGEEDIRYITWYTEEGIFCREAGQTEGYIWAIRFENKEQYDRVMEFIGRLSSEGDMHFAANENFWKDFLNDKERAGGGIYGHITDKNGTAEISGSHADSVGSESNRDYREEQERNKEKSDIL